ncbi:DNA polymerase III subunit beta [Cryptosporangium phraense]|uniref:DNA polymerase III subunit beta n=1 Tax=Cryptosporangium phraense TaxID=2593070 RepID=A0A545AQJ5_9ACTN|nr:DNA polymerase III subunit beta [Cryptosporangium phraense]TQS43608.1 DNA polymerase III subunit beta [Cryptosporangium phraense]
MRFWVKRESLAEAVTWGTRCAATHPTNPALGGALLELASGELTITSFDGESSARMGVAVETAEDDGPDGSALVSARLLVEITKALPDQAIDVELADGVLRLRCGGGRFGLPTMPVEDYPRPPVLSAPTGTVDAALFGTAVAQVAVAASREESLPILTSVRLAVAGGRMSLLASDRYRAARRELAWEPVDPKREGEFLVPARALLDAARAFAQVPETLTVVVDEDVFEGGTIGFTAAGRQLSTRLLEGTFPAVGRLFEVPRPTTATVSVGALTEVVKRVALFADRTTPVSIRLTPIPPNPSAPAPPTGSAGTAAAPASAGPDAAPASAGPEATPASVGPGPAPGPVGPRAGGSATVEARGARDAEASEAIEADFTGQDVTLAFNETYLLDGLRSVGSPRVTLSFDDPLKPVMLTPAGEPAGADYVLQPVRVR